MRSATSAAFFGVDFSWSLEYQLLNTSTTLGCLAKYLVHSNHVSLYPSMCFSCSSLSPGVFIWWLSCQIQDFSDAVMQPHREALEEQQQLILQARELDGEVRKALHDYEHYQSIHVKWAKAVEDAKCLVSQRQEWLEQVAPSVLLFAMAHSSTRYFFVKSPLSLAGNSSPRERKGIQ